ncbi:MAG: hypothetical protein RLZZ129_796, partial [Verrucomicrobiota bacterium]
MGSGVGAKQSLRGAKGDGDEKTRPVWRFADYDLRRKRFARAGVARGMKIFPVLGALFPVLAAAQDLDGMFKGGKIEVPAISANPSENGRPVKPAGIFHP